MKKEIKRLVQLVFGLFLYGLGMYLCVQANVGLAPWDAFHWGVSHQLGVSMGTVAISTGLLIIIVDFFLGEQIGVGSVANAILVGVFLDWFTAMELLLPVTHFGLGLLVLMAGLTTIAIATYFYSSTALGCGPRDALMVALRRRFPHVSVGVIRGSIEGAVLVGGWLCGAKVGLGTVAAVFGIGVIVQVVFHVAHFEVTAVAHESLSDTWKRWKRG